MDKITNELKRAGFKISIKNKPYGRRNSNDLELSLIPPKRPMKMPKREPSFRDNKKSHEISKEEDIKENKSNEQKSKKERNTSEENKNTFDNTPIPETDPNLKEDQNSYSEEENPSSNENINESQTVNKNLSQKNQPLPSPMSNPMPNSEVFKSPIKRNKYNKFGNRHFQYTKDREEKLIIQAQSEFSDDEVEIESILEDNEEIFEVIVCEPTAVSHYSMLLKQYKSTVKLCKEVTQAYFYSKEKKEVKGTKNKPIQDYFSIAAQCNNIIKATYSVKKDETKIKLIGDNFQCFGPLNTAIEIEGEVYFTKIKRHFFKKAGEYEIIFRIFNKDTFNSVAGLFEGCKDLVSVNFNKFDFSKMTSFKNLFYGCFGLKSVDLSNTNTYNLTDLSYCFFDCCSLKSINFDNFYTDAIINLNCMFGNCSSLTSLDLFDFNTTNVTNMRSMFLNCSQLEYVNVEGFNTSKVITFKTMFYNCKKLVYVDISNFNLSKAIHTGGMFYGCESLAYIDLKDLNIYKILDKKEMI
ncbi:MAG: DUF285 domain-containing protein [archaeon]|nr:DUF285 domain-containing protein [archaeon]